MKILWGVESMHAATTRYRVVIPSRPLRRIKGMQIDLHESIDRKILENFTYDLVCLQRAAGGNTMPFVEELLKQEIPIIYDMDDDIFNIETSSPVYGLYMNRPDIPMRQLTAMRLSNGITVSTPQLEKVYWGVNENAAVIPNAFDVNDWRPENFPHLSFGDDNVMLVWEGSRTHNDSLELMLPTLHRIMQMYQNVGLVFMGLDRLPSNTLPRERTFCFGWSTYANLQTVLSACHIGLAPLAPSKFNLSKSNLRILEYACAGLAIVGSPHGEYTAALTDAGQFLCKNEADWELALTKLIESPKLRRDKMMLAKEWVLQYEIRNHAHKWTEAWSKFAGINL